MPEIVEIKIMETQTKPWRYSKMKNTLNKTEVTYTKPIDNVG